MLIYGYMNILDMQSQLLQKVHEKVDEMVFESHGVKMIGLGSYCLDFKNNYVFLGYTKNGEKAILGDIHTIGPDGVKYNKKYGKFEIRENSKFVNGEMVVYNYVQLVTDGHRYSETILEIVN